MPLQKKVSALAFLLCHSTTHAVTYGGFLPLPTKEIPISTLVYTLYDKVLFALRVGAIIYVGYPSALLIFVITVASKP